MKGKFKKQMKRKQTLIVIHMHSLFLLGTLSIVVFNASPVRVSLR